MLHAYVKTFDVTRMKVLGWKLNKGYVIVRKKKSFHLKKSFVPKKKKRSLLFLKKNPKKSISLNSPFPSYLQK